jgi:isoleucyl-tRNA synthetase
MRKEAGFEVVDRIAVAVGGPAEFKTALTDWSEYIRNETLAADLNLEFNSLEFSKEWSIDGSAVKISIARKKTEGAM